MTTGSLTTHSTAASESHDAADNIDFGLTSITPDSLLAMTNGEARAFVSKEVAPEWLSAPIHPFSSSSVMPFDGDPPPAYPELSPVSFPFLHPGFVSSTLP